MQQTILAIVLGLAAAMPATTAEQRIEAEGTANAATVAAEWAWGGKAASSGTAWDALLRTGELTSLPEQVHVWLRHRHGAVCLKSIVRGQQVERGWAWGASEEFAWSRLGPFTAAQLAGGLIVIRGDAGADHRATELDCIVLSASDRQPADPPRAPRPGVVEARIAWDTTVARTGPRSFGLNLAHAFDLAALADPRYRAGIARMAPGYVRLHNGAQADDAAKGGIWDYAGKRLDRARIAQLCPLWKGIAPEIMMNIAGWPAWMDADHDGRLDEERIGEYAAACAELVRLVNIEGRVGIHLWETSNERDGAYWIDGPRPARPDLLARIHAACATAMRAVDPSIAVGGPAATRPDKVGELTEFVAGCGDSLEFLSFHAYASGSATDSDQRLIARAGEIAQQAHDLQTRLAASRAAAGRRPLPGILDEYNISWTWETRDQRMTNQFSAVFDALVLTGLAQRGVEGSAAWNECDGIYGKMDGGFALRPAAEVFARANRALVGAVASVNVDADGPQVLAVKRNDGTHAVMLTNADVRPVVVHLGGAAGRAHLTVLADGAVSERDGAWDDQLELPGRSIVWLDEP